MNGKSGTVIIVEDDPPLLSCLVGLFERQGYKVQAHTSYRQILRKHSPVGPACLILDLDFCKEDGLEVCSRLKSGGWNLPVIIITAFGDIPAAVRAMREGVEDYINKPFSFDGLVLSVRRALAKSKQHWNTDPNHAELLRRSALLTLREREVLCLATGGMLNKQIAEHLKLALVTVKVHRGHAMRKLGARNAAELMNVARSVGICPESCPAPPLNGAAAKHAER